jgi:hypothetical protein
VIEESSFHNLQCKLLQTDKLAHTGADDRLETTKAILHNRRHSQNLSMQLDSMVAGESGLNT